MNTPPAIPVFMRAKDMAAHVGIGESSLWKLAAERPDFPPLRKPGKRTSLFNVSAVVAFINGQTTATAAAEGAGFEPAARIERAHAFQACDLSHSSTLPAENSVALASYANNLGTRCKAPGIGASGRALCPTELLAIGDLRRMDLSEYFPAVYFLCQSKRVVYVGQSLYPRSRIADHRREGTKIFDSVYLRHFMESELDRMESVYIHSLQPYYNGVLPSGTKLSPNSVDDVLVLLTHVNRRIRKKRALARQRMANAEV